MVKRIAFLTSFLFVGLGLSAQEREIHRMQVAFADSSVGWSVGSVKHGGLATADSSGKTYYNTVLMKTMDGGRSWVLQTVIQTGPEAPDVKYVFAFDATTCWVALSQDGQDKDFIVYTTDGVKWQVAAFPFENMDIKKIYFRNARQGWIIANEPFGFDRLFSSADGGKTWKQSDLTIDGTFYDVKFRGNQGYVTGRSRSKPSKMAVFRSNDGGSIWIVAAEIGAGEGTSMENGTIEFSKDTTVVVGTVYDKNDPDRSYSALYASSDAFVSFEEREISHESSKGAGTWAHNFDLVDGVFYAVDRPWDLETRRETRMIASDDLGRTWRVLTELKTPKYLLTYRSDKAHVASNDDGELFVVSEQGEILADMDFRGVFRPAPRIETPASSLFFYAEEDAFEKDSVYTSRWESEEDSLVALQFSSLADVTKYKVDTSREFSVGIDSVFSTHVVLHRRVRRGSKHLPWDLIKEEAVSGSITLRKYQTVRLVGSVHHPPDRQIVQYSWSSSINGELSRDLAFTTHPKQLVAGVHYIFFKAQDDRGVWSEPVVLRIIVEDFPKIKFPFEGLWSAGGSGSYYNRGHHIRGITYALDLNYQEGIDGGDSDYGLPVKASTDGVVSFAGYVRGYGRMVVVDYLYGGKKYSTLVSHLSAISVEVGEVVRQGQELGACGSTGRSSAPHIHWELRVDGVCTPPEPLFVNDTTVVQFIRDGGLYRSENNYEPPNIVVVDDYEIPQTIFNPKGYRHSYRYSYITNRDKTVEMIWRPKLPRTGPYRIQVMIPKKFATVPATYRLHTSAGVKEFVVNQNKYTEEWITLGNFDLDANDDVYVSLDNVTSYKRGTIAFDAIRFVGLWENPRMGMGEK